MADTKAKRTDRDRFYARLPGGPDGRISMTFNALFRGRNEETIVEALKAAAQMYFDEFTDATTLPDEFWKFVELCSDMTYGLGLDLDEFDRDNWEDDDLGDKVVLSPGNGGITYVYSGGDVAFETPDHAAAHRWLTTNGFTGIVECLREGCPDA